MEYMTIGMCLDYIDHYSNEMNPDKKEKARKATQADMDAF